MDTPAPDPNLPIPKRLQIAQIIALAMLGSIGTYALLVVIMRAAGEPPPPRPMDPTLRTAIWVLALGCMALGPTLTDRFYPRPEPASDHTVASMLVTRMIIKLATLEAGAIFGLLIFFLTLDWKDFAVLAGLAAVLMLPHIPTRAQWENEARTHNLDWSLR